MVVLTSSPGNANVNISLVLVMCLEVMCFQSYFCDFVNVIVVLKIYKTESCSIVIVGGQIVVISFRFNLCMKCTHSSQHRFLDNVFDVFRRSTEFLGCRRLDLAYANRYNLENCIAVLFLQT